MSDAGQLLELLSKTFTQTLGVAPSVVSTDKEPPNWGQLLAEERRLKENETSQVRQVWSVLDVLGTYEPLTCTITIYQAKIQEWARSHGWDPAILERIVRIHEFGHAFVHVGISEPEDSSASAWLLERNRFWAAVNPATENHEFLAQSFTWIALKEFADAGGLATFEELMETQPACYRLWDGGERLPKRLWEQYIEDGRCVRGCLTLAGFWATFTTEVRSDFRQSATLTERSLLDAFASPYWHAEKDVGRIVEEL
jgi:hypothetical protein